MCDVSGLSPRVRARNVPQVVRRVSAQRTQRKRLCVNVAAEPPGKPDNETVKQTVRELREAQVDRETAQEIMKLWKDNGITDDPVELQKLYQKRGGDAYARFGFQMFLDLCACFAVRPSTPSLSSARRGSWVPTSWCDACARGGTAILRSVESHGASDSQPVHDYVAGMAAPIGTRVRLRRATRLACL